GVAVRRIWRTLLRWYFKFFYSHRLQRPAVVEVDGFPFLIMPGVFNPCLFFTGEFLARHLRREPILPEARVLDLGTGCGIAAVFASLQARRVVAVDIEQAAVRCAQINVWLNQAEHCVEIRQGDLFSGLDGERFDLVLFNPPYFRGDPQTPLERAFRSQDIDARFADSLREHLVPGGSALLVLSSMGEERSFLEKLHARGFRCDPIAEERKLLEIFRIYRVEFESDAL
ncbi:MAG TPA: methyltransferase, partial [Acidobacteriota bacterium]|nr:methyltransferase [Acidobacteriota bacterium]